MDADEGHSAHQSLQQNLVTRSQHSHTCQQVGLKNKPIFWNLGLAAHSCSADTGLLVGYDQAWIQPVTYCMHVLYCIWMPLMLQLLPQVLDEHRGLLTLPALQCRPQSTKSIL